GDPVTQVWSIDGIPGGIPAGAGVVSVMRRPGVMDPVEASVKLALAAVGLPVVSVRAVRRYVVAGSKGPLAPAALVEAVREHLANEAIAEIHTGAELDLHPVQPAAYSFRRVEVPLTRATDDELIRISKD